jgi:hypothetical protein
MFVQYFALVPVGFTDAETRLMGLVDGMGESADIAYRHGEELITRIGAGDGSIAKAVRLEVGEPSRGADQIVLPISWWATGTPFLFPTMDAELVLVSLGPDLTQISLHGTYKPPIGAVGRALDKMVFHRYAEASVKDFVDRIAVGLGGTSRD